MVLNQEVRAKRHVAETIISMRLKMDPEVIAQYLPEPFETHRKGEVTIMLADLYCNDETMNEMARQAGDFVYPYFTTMQEGLLSIPCKLDGAPGQYLAKVWENKDCFVQRGPVLGYDTELAEVHINRFPGRLRKLYAPQVGSKIKGVVRQNAETIISGWIELTQAMDKYPEDEYMVCYGRRQVEDMLDPSRKLLDDVLLEHHDSEIKGQVYQGNGHLKLGGFMKNWDYELVDAYFFDIGFSTSGWKVLKDMNKQ